MRHSENQLHNYQLSGCVFFAVFLCDFVSLHESSCVRIISRKDAKAPGLCKAKPGRHHRSVEDSHDAAISVAGFAISGILRHRTATLAENDQSDTDGH